MLVTNDGIQDALAMACAKSYIYKECLLDHMNKVICVADAAGCFKWKLHRTTKGFLKILIGIYEIKYQLTPTSDGKTCLDRMFGYMSVILSSAVDNG